MGTGEDTKPEKQSSPPPDQANMHVYPDWAAMQAYYGHRVAMPPYYNPAVTSGQTPPPHPYMWGAPQPMMSPYGTPYAAFYPHGGVYAHPGVPPASTPNVETPTKSSGNTDKGLMKKLKSFDGLAMSIGPANDSAGDGADHSQSQSEETEVSSDGSSGNTMGAGQKNRKRSHEETPTPGGNRKAETQIIPISDSKLNAGNVLPCSVSANVVGTITGLELRTLPTAIAKVSPSTSSGVPLPSGVTSKTWLQDERELKRERRKQSNRESARRSRLRKQAEAEELAIKVDILIAENVALKSDITELTEKSENMKLENATLLEKLKNAQGSEIGDNKRMPKSTENLLSRVDSSLPSDRSSEGSGKTCDNNTSSGGKLRQLLDSSPRADAVAAS